MWGPEWLHRSGSDLYGGFPKLGVAFLGVPIIRTIMFGGLYWGPPILGKYHMRQPIAVYNAVFEFRQASTLDNP